ncbi:MAG: tetratricopeptide repeat protein [Nitrospinae bacterium]|nr:tetratricopeptide repeat protein [Nitrospinota bacterium]
MGKRVAVIALAFGAMAFGDPAYFNIARGNKLYAEGKYEEALAEYLKAKSSDPARSEADYNTGAAQFKTGRLKESAGAYERVMGGANADIKSSARFNRSAALYAGGVSASEAGELDEAMKMFKDSAEGYKAALKERPSDNDIRHNLELALAKLKDAEDQKKKQEQNSSSDSKDSRDNDGQDKKEKEEAGKDGQPKEEKKQSADHKKPEQSDGAGSGEKQEMTADEAERALAAVQSDEKDLRKKIRNQNVKEQPRSGKDW